MRGVVKKFTLMELLIVVSVIVILLSLLLPALNRARDKAREISCVGNKKQCMLGQQLYANDNTGYMLVTTPYKASSNLSNPHSYHFFHTGLTGYPPYTWWNIYEGQGQAYVKWASLVCPSNTFGQRVKNTGFRTQNQEFMDKYFYGTYGTVMYLPAYDKNVTGDFAYFPNYKYYVPGKCKISSKIWIVADSRGSAGESKGHYIIGLRDAGSNIHLAHDRKSVNGFLDGHVAAMTLSAMRTSPVPLKGSVYDLDGNLL